MWGVSSHGWIPTGNFMDKITNSEAQSWIPVAFLHLTLDSLLAVSPGVDIVQALRQENSRLKLCKLCNATALCQSSREFKILWHTDAAWFDHGAAVLVSLKDVKHWRTQQANQGFLPKNILISFGTWGRVLCIIRWVAFRLLAEDVVSVSCCWDKSVGTGWVW